MANCIHLASGDEFLATAKAKALLEEFLPPPQDPLALEVIDGRCDTADQAVEAVGRCMEALATLGFFGARKGVWFRWVNFLTDTPVGKVERVKAALGRLAEMLKRGLPPEVALVITAEQVDKRYAFYRAIAEVGAFHDLAVTDKRGAGQDQIRHILEDCLTSHGLQMRAEVQQSFLERVGADMRTLTTEVAKLAAYAGTRRALTVADLDAVTSWSKDAAAWDIQDAFGRRDMPGCLAVMRRLLFQRETPMAMIALLEARIRDLIVYREAMDRGWLRLVAGARNATWGTMPPEGESLLVTALGRDYRSIHPFRLKLLVEQAAGFSLAELRRCQRTAAAAHRQLVTSSLPATLILDMMVIRALQPARGRAASARNAQTAPRR